jgi:hypothetical protein
MAHFEVALANADAPAPEAAAQLCSSLASLAAAAEGVFVGVEARVASDRRAWRASSWLACHTPRLTRAAVCRAERLAALSARLVAAGARVDAVAALRQRVRYIAGSRLLC